MKKGKMLAELRRFLREWVVPPGFLRLRDQIALRRAMRLTAAESTIMMRNALFRNLHAGRRCFVIGNGASLKTQDISPLANEITFVMSGFWKHPIVEKWQPTYYCFADPLFFDGSEPVRRFFLNLNARIHTTTFFVPLYSKEVIKRMSLLPEERTYFVAFQGALWNGLSAKPDFTRFVPGPRTVAQLAIMAAMYMGCSPIYLLGLDHDLATNRSTDRHFYEGTTIENHLEAHGDVGQRSYKWILELLLQWWQGYEAILRVADTEGIKIINATNGGFLDLFDRADYESVIRGKF